MQNALKVEIKRLSRRAFKKALRLKKNEEKYRKQFEKRTGQIAGVAKPKGLAITHKHFDPVYCSRNANFLAKTIWHKVLENTYEPIPAVHYQLPKPDGKKRDIMAFSIPDAALANVILIRARERNRKRLSPSSYAYHPDKNVFDAILAISEFKPENKLFAVQIDFEKYFDNIPSWYLKNRINDAEKISLTPHERYIFDRFIHHQFALHSEYGLGVFKRRHKGTPQGSSVSLLLANIANHDLDVKLSASSGRFVRFADDVLALCDDYSQAQQLERCFVSHCANSGLIINLKKSPGIAIISNNEQEIRSYKHIDYLGYRLSSGGLSMPDRTAQRIRARASRLINLYLIQYLDIGFNVNRASIAPYAFDWDLLGLIYEVRRSLYGGLSESELEGFIQKGKKLRKMKGLMGFYSLLEDSHSLKELDGWLLSTIRRAMKERNIILQSKYGMQCPTPSNKELATGTWLDLKSWRGESPPEVRVPSLVRGWRAARKYFFTFGLESVQPPTYGSYTDIDDLFDYQ